MSVYKRLDIKSNIRNYSVLFTDSFKCGWDMYPDRDKYFIVDRNIIRYYKKELGGILNKYPVLAVEASEAHKTLDYADVIIRKLISGNIKKNHIIVAIGGGIIQDIAGFVASILYRGIDWIFYPTTLLAQCDSCIGSKTSINIGGYKNQAGNFYPPMHIFLNTAFLGTLSSADIKSGLGEIIKVHLLDGVGSFNYIINNYDRSLKDLKIMKSFIFRSLNIKKKIIELDEFDKGYRNIMNYGHTFGHALESITNYRLCHGQAVTIGMDLSNYLSYKNGYISERMYLKMGDLLKKNWPKYDISGSNVNLFLRMLTRDKKNTNNNIKAILTRGPGRMFKAELTTDAATKRNITAYFNNNLIDHD